MCPVRSYECVPTNPGSPPPKYSPAIHFQSAFATPADENECDERRSNEWFLSFANWLVKSTGHEDMHQNRMVCTTRQSIPHPLPYCTSWKDQEGKWVGVGNSIDMIIRSRHLEYVLHRSAGSLNTRASLFLTKQIIKWKLPIEIKISLMIDISIYSFQGRDHSPMLCSL